MAQVMESHVDPSSSKEDELHQLNLKLDDLFERYLNLLDQYQAARLELSTQLSSVCVLHLLDLVSLADFGRASSRWLKQTLPRIRGYDMERTTMMSGCKRQGGCEFYHLSTLNFSPSTSSIFLTNIRTIEETKDGLEKFTILSPVSQDDSEAEEDDESTSADKKEAKEDDESKPVDPIRWYGVLVPPTLRTAQSQFVSAVEGPIPRVINLSKELRNLEIDIGRTRKTMKKLGKV
jgi:hypothetical protein